jgi:hypothetical protein
MTNTQLQIERKDTGIRILLSVLFIFVVHIGHAVIGAVTLFSLVFALITKRPPGDRVRQFANRTASYLYRVLRYLTYNESEPPFPFADFPQELEPLAPFPPPRAGEKQEQNTTENQPTPPEVTSLH